MSEETKEAFEALNDALRAMGEALEPLVQLMEKMLDALVPVCAEIGQRRAKVKQLRRDFVRKRGLRR